MVNGRTVDSKNKEIISRNEFAALFVSIFSKEFILLKNTFRTYKKWV